MSNPARVRAILQEPTAALIPLEVWHTWHHPNLAAVIILIVNCFIVWFLYLVLRRKLNPAPPPVEYELAKIR